MKMLCLLIGLVLAGCASMAEVGGDAVPSTDAEGTLLVGNKDEDTLSFVNLATGEELARLPTGPAPHEIAISPDGSLAAVVAYGGAQIDFYDVAARAKVATLDLSPNRHPHGLLWLSDDRLLATTEGSGTLTVIGEADILGKRTVTGIPTGQEGSHMVAVSPDLTRAWVANLGSGSVTLVDLEAGEAVRSVPTGGGTEGIAVTPDGSLVLASSREAEKVTFLTPELETIAEVPVGGIPLRVAISPDGRWAVTSNYGDGTLSVIDIAARRLARTIRVGGSASSEQVTILFSRDGERMYVAETADDVIAEVDFGSGMVLRRLPAGRQGDGLAIVP